MYAKQFGLRSICGQMAVYARLLFPLGYFFLDSLPVGQDSLAQQQTVIGL
jgi:hypothetical protein